MQEGKGVGEGECEGKKKKREGEMVGSLSVGRRRGK